MPWHQRATAATTCFANIEKFKRATSRTEQWNYAKKDRKNIEITYNFMQRRMRRRRGRHHAANVVCGKNEKRKNRIRSCEQQVMQQPQHKQNKQNHHKQQKQPQRHELKQHQQHQQQQQQQQSVSYLRSWFI